MNTFVNITSVSFLPGYIPEIFSHQKTLYGRQATGPDTERNEGRNGWNDFIQMVLSTLNIFLHSVHSGCYRENMNC
jgi:hypothetical protein